MKWNQFIPNFANTFYMNKMSDVLELFIQLVYKQELSVPEKNGFHLLIFQFQNIYKPVAKSNPKRPLCSVHYTMKNQKTGLFCCNLEQQ